MVSHTACIFHMPISYCKKFSLVPRLRSSAKFKVKYQGQILELNRNRSINKKIGHITLIGE